MAYAIFSTEQSYNVGDVVVHDGIAYTFLYPHIPGEWNSAQVLAITPSFSYASPVQDFNTLPDYNVSSPLPPSKFRVNYLPNNDSINIPEMFVVDTGVYAPGETVIIKNYGIGETGYTHFSEDGVWAYTWKGWSLAKGSADGVDYVPGAHIIMPSRDVTLYAQWTKTATIEVSPSYVCTLKREYKDRFNKLIIPEYFGGIRIKTIGTEAFKDSSISEIVIPASIETIQTDAFSGWSGTTLRFIDNVVTLKYPLLNLTNGCFNDTPNLTQIILPYRWQNVIETTGKIFGEQAKADVLHIYIRNTKEYMTELLRPDENPFDVEAYIADPDNLGIAYTRIFHWGYND